MCRWETNQNVRVQVWNQHNWQNPGEKLTKMSRSMWEGYLDILILYFSLKYLYFLHSIFLYSWGTFGALQANCNRRTMWCRELLRLSNIQHFNFIHKSVKVCKKMLSKPFFSFSVQWRPVLICYKGMVKSIALLQQVYWLIDWLIIFVLRHA